MLTASSPRLTRPAVLDVLALTLADAGVRWAFQGATGAAQTWLGSRGPADLDIWWDPRSTNRQSLVSALTTSLGAAVVADTDDEDRLQHTSLAVETPEGLAVLDLTAGDLRVGAVLLLPAARVDVAPTADGPRLRGVAAAADLLVRPLLRGRLPDRPRLVEARAAWHAADPADQAWAALLWRRELGRASADVVAVLDGEEPSTNLPLRLRRRLLLRTLRPRALRSTWRQRASIRPAGRAAGPLGLRTRGVVVALVGTDGSGKTTVATQLRDRLDSLGLASSEAYFGMARGNLPGVGAARRLLGVAPADAQEGDREEEQGGSANTRPAEPPSADTQASRHPRLRRLAAWYYAVEYVWRYLRMVAPARRARRVVVCDRYVYDLEQSPWPGSPAAAWVRAVVPAPDVLVLPDAPASVIHQRKPERPLAEQAAQQAWLQSLLATRPARCAELVVDTSGDTLDPVGPVVRAVVEAAHGSRR